MNIAGNKNIISFLEKAIAGQRLAGTYIFCGPKSVGKTAAAEWAAAKLLNTPQDRLRTNPDFLKIGEDAISKEGADTAINWLALSPFGGKHKLLIINNAHEMSASAANAFLKTLEEPSKRAVIILITSEPGKILPTIISRSAVFHFKPASKDEIFQFLKNEHGILDAKPFVNASCGKPGRAVDLIKNPEMREQASAGIKEFYQLFFGECAERFGVSARLQPAKGENIKEKISCKIDFWLEIVRDALLLKYGLNDELTHTNDGEALHKIARLKSAGYFASLGTKLIKMRQLLSNNINFKLILENLII